MMNGSLALSWLVAGTWGLAAPGDVAVVPAPSLQQLAYTSYWTVQVPLAKGDRVGDLVLVDEVLYVSTEHGILFAIQTDVGLIRWGQGVTEPGIPFSRPVHLRNGEGTGPAALLVPSGVLVIDRYTGQRMALVSTPFTSSSPPAGTTQQLILGSVDGQVYNVHWRTAREGWVMKRWSVRAGGLVTARPVLAGPDRVIWAARSGKVIAATLSDKTLEWSFTAGDGFVADPVIDELAVYVASLDRSLYKLSRDGGVVLWRYRSSQPLVETPTVTRDTLYLPCGDDGLTAIDVDSGRPRWQRPGVRKFLATVGDQVVLINDQSALELVEKSTGRVLQTVSVGSSPLLSADNARDSSLYLATADGRIQCAQPVDHAYVRVPAIHVARINLNVPPSPVAPSPRFPAGKSANEPREDPFQSDRDQSP